MLMVHAAAADDVIDDDVVCANMLRRDRWNNLKQVKIITDPIAGVLHVATVPCCNDLS